MPRSSGKSGWLWYLLTFAAVAALAFGVCSLAAQRPGVVLGIVLLVTALAGWIASSIASTNLLGAILARRESRASPLMTVLASACWSVGNMLVVCAIVVGAAMVTGLIGGGGSEGTP